MCALNKFAKGKVSIHQLLHEDYHADISLTHLTYGHVKNKSKPGLVALQVSTIKPKECRVQC